MASVNNVVNPFLAPSIVPLPHNVKDSRWLTLEVCREYQRNKCSRTENECKFAHPPAHVEVQNGRVVCCFDSLKGKCQRKDPPCKYLHPPNHLREFLMQNGRNNLIMKNLQMQFLQNSIFAPNSGGGVIPLSALDAAAQGTSPSAKLLIPGANAAALPPGLQASYSLLPYLQAPHPSSPAAAAGPPGPGNPYQQLLGGAALPPASALIAASHDPTNLMNASMAAAAMAGLPSAAQAAAVNGVVVSSAGHLNGSSPTATVTTMSASLPSMAGSVASKSTQRSSDARMDTPQEMLFKAKKRSLDDEAAANSSAAQAAAAASPAFLPLGLGIPAAAYPGLTAKRPAVADSKSGLPVYQPQGITSAAAAAAAAAAAYPGLTTMQLPGGQHAFIPAVPTSTFVGHTASLPRF